MPDPTIAIALVLLIALVEATPAIRVPTGLLLATALLAADAELLPIAALGAIGVTLARLTLALVARAGRDRARPAPPHVEARRAALRAQLSRSSAYARTTFVLAALPGVPAGFVFPLLGAMRMPLWPALAGTLVGRVPVLAISTAVFAWLGRAVTSSDTEAATLLGVMSIMVLVLRTFNRIDWQHRSATGEWRMRPEADPFVRMGLRVDDIAVDARFSAGEASDDDPDVVEGELLGEEVDGEDDQGTEEPPRTLPPTSDGA
jgi:membrane protein YqaA with SNARE-associated domain